MWYLGGKCRQSKKIVEYIGKLCPDFQVYVEPFCGGMWSGCAVMRTFPNRIYRFSDNNPWLINFWQAAKDGWNPPREISEETYNRYRDARPLDDPMTAYCGFAWSFGGKFFGGLARTNAGDVEGKGSVNSTLDKVQTIRVGNASFSCCDFTLVRKPLLRTIVYLDPSYSKRTKQHSKSLVDYGEFYRYAEALADQGAMVLATSFTNERNRTILHNYGDTVVRHLNGKKPDGTEELLMLVPKRNERTLL